MIACPYCGALCQPRGGKMPKHPARSPRGKIAATDCIGSSESVEVVERIAAEHRQLRERTGRRAG